MKKLFISLVAIAAAVFATSCTNDLVDSVNGYEGKTAKVGIEVSTPELATRTFGDGKSATNLYYGVYDEHGVLLPEISVIDIDTPAEIKIKTTVNLELVTGDTYTIVFWAQNAGSAATIDWANKTMTFDPQTASKEEYDAFYGKIEFKVEGPATLKADLKRPFAQVNIGTADYEKAQKAGMTVDEVKVVVKSFKTLNFAVNVQDVDYSVSGEKTYTYNFAAAPTEDFPVAGYEYMSMNYVLVNEAKHLVDVEMTYTNTEGKPYDVVYGNVPVQRNYRTNIYGNLLTDQTGVIVEIKPAFEEPAYGEVWDGVSIAEPTIVGNVMYIHDGYQLAWFAANANGATVNNDNITRAETTFEANNYEGWIIKLTNDIDLGEKAWTPIEMFKGTFDGQGHTIKNLYVNEESDKGSAGLFGYARDVKNLTIDGFKVYGHYKAGAITGDGLCSKIENCHAKNGEVISTVSANTKDHANHVGGIVGYLSAEPTAYVKGCSVENVTVKGYRDVGAIAGTANQAAAVKNCIAKNATVTADQTAEYKEVKAPNAGEIVGRVHAKATVNDNYAEGVEVSINADAAHIDNLLNVKDEYVTINLTEDVVINGECYREYAGAETKVLTINGNGFTLTYKDGYRTYIKLANPEGKLVLNDLKLYRETTNADIHYHNNNMSIYCNTDMNGVELNKGIILTNGSKFVFNNVNINKGKVATYAMFIKAGCDVTIDGMNITHSEGVNGRGIKVIDEDMTGEIPSTKLTIANTKFVTEEKAAVLVGSKGGANIVWGEGNDISKVKEDTKFAVWVDEDWAAYDDLVTVTGCYKKIEGSNDYIAATEEELKEALKNGGNVVLDNPFTIEQSSESNGYGVTGISQLNGGTIDGNGNDISVNAWGTWDSAINTTGGTIKNINVTGGMRGIFVNHNSAHSEKVILENVVIDGTVYTISCDQGTNKGLEATNSTFNGWTSYAATLGNAKFTNCKFGEGSGYAYFRPYAPTEFVGCEFEAGFALDNRAAVTFENCTLDGVALTAENITDLVYNTNNATVK